MPTPGVFKHRVHDQLGAYDLLSKRLLIQDGFAGRTHHAVCIFMTASACDQKEMGGGMRDGTNDALYPEIGLVVWGPLPIVLCHGTKLCRLLETRIANLKHPAQREEVDERVSIVLVTFKQASRLSGRVHAATCICMAPFGWKQP